MSAAAAISPGYAWRLSFDDKKRRPMPNAAAEGGGMM